MKKLLSIILLALPVTVMAGNFTGNEIRISSEAWKADKDGKFSTIATGTDIRVKPFYNSGIDAEKFEMGEAGSGLDHFWSIDFHMDGIDTIDLTYTNPQVSYPYYQYHADLGFHFHDVEDTWRPIVGVTVSTPFAPLGFDPSLIRFDENNIYVNLKNSSCVDGACGNVSSPTGFNNIITLNVQFEGNPYVYRMGEIDLMFDWLEETMPHHFPSHRESFYDLSGYPTRLYPRKGGVFDYTHAGGIMVFKGRHATFYSGNGSLDFASIDYCLHVSGIAVEEARKKDARRKAAREEEKRKEAERQKAERKAEHPSHSVHQIDSLFDWLEDNYPEHFPSHQESYYRDGYRTRYYPSNNAYLFVKGGHAHFHSDYEDVKSFSLEYLFELSGITAEDTED